MSYLSLSPLGEKPAIEQDRISSPVPEGAGSQPAVPLTGESPHLVY